MRILELRSGLIHPEYLEAAIGIDLDRLLRAVFQGLLDPGLDRLGIFNFVRRGIYRASRDISLKR